jgi:hypothetical protein
MKPKYKIVKRSVKHTFTTEETAQLNTEFRQSFANLKSVEAEFDSVKASYKAKTTEAESRMETLNATLQAGFELQDKSCVVIMDMKSGKKSFYLESDLVDGEIPKGVEPVIVEDITDADRQQELIEAEARFEAREDIELFSPAGDDHGLLMVGRFEGKWFSALRVKIGTRVISERLDSEQSCSNKRCDQVKLACKFFNGWLDKNLGKEEAKGFMNAVNLAIVAHAERE